MNIKTLKCGCKVTQLEYPAPWKPQIIYCPLHGARGTCWSALRKIAKVEGPFNKLTVANDCIDNMKAIANSALRNHGDTAEAEKPLDTPDPPDTGRGVLL